MPGRTVSFDKLITTLIDLIDVFVIVIYDVIEKLCFSKTNPNRKGDKSILIILFYIKTFQNNTKNNF